MRVFGPDSDKQAAYLATLNQSAGASPYELKTLPRVKGKGTRVVITEYDLPRRPLMPHDVIVDQEGIVWYSQFDQQFLGRFDPKTLKHTEFAIPVQRPDRSEEHTSELQSHSDLVCRLLLEKKKEIHSEKSGRHTRVVHVSP